MSFPAVLNNKGRDLAWIRRTFGDDLGDRSLLGVIDQLTPAGRQLISELAAALWATETIDAIEDNFHRAELGNFLHPEMSAFEKAIHEAYAMGLQLTP